jgi:hypothetical protein
MPYVGTKPARASLDRVSLSAATRYTSSFGGSNFAASLGRARHCNLGLYLAAVVTYLAIRRES